MARLKVRVDSPRVHYTEESIEAEYEYRTSRVTTDNNDHDDTRTVRISLRSIGSSTYVHLRIRYERTKLSRPRAYLSPVYRGIYHRKEIPRGILFAMFLPAYVESSSFMVAGCLSCLHTSSLYACK